MGTTAILLIYLSVFVIIIGTFFVLFKVKSIKPKKDRVKTIKLQRDKVRPTISIVFIVKNNQLLLKSCSCAMNRFKEYIFEVIVLDLGSIDCSINEGNKLFKKYNRFKVFNISERVIKENYYNIVRAHVEGQVVLILDLFRMEAENPNVYVPDLFKPIEEIGKKDGLNSDLRIDGTKLLYLDRWEREKSSFIIKEYLIEVLSNVSMRMEPCKEKIKRKSKPEVLLEDIDDMQQYIDKSIKDIIEFLRISGPIKYKEKNLDDNIANVLKDYSQNKTISIEYKIIGKSIRFKSTINDLIISIVQDFLYMIIQTNLCTKIDVKVKYSKKHYNLLISCNYLDEEAQLYNSGDGLNHLVINSINNRLNLVNGSIRITEGKSTLTRILVQLPTDETICLSKEEESE